MATLVSHKELVAMGSYLMYAKEHKEDEVYWVWLHELPSVSILQKKRLLKFLGTPQAIFEASDKDLREALALPRDHALPEPLCTTRNFNPLEASRSFMSIRTKQISRVEEILRTHRHLGIKVLTYHSPSYRSIVKEDRQAPLVYYYRGQLQKPDLPIVGVISSSTKDSKDCREVCQQYRARGFTLATGVSFGTSIETLSQIVSDESVVYAFVGGGLDRCYPVEIWPILENVMDNGAIISEYSLGTRPTIYRAIKRNRNIALWSNEVVSLPEKQLGISRSVIYTAHQYKRPVYVQVQQAKHASIAGTKEREPVQLRRVFGHPAKTNLETSFPIGSENEWICAQIADLLQYVPMPTKELASALQLKESGLLTILIDMELNGMISCQRGDTWHYRRH